MNILTKEFNFEIASVYYKKILHQTVIANGSITEKRFMKSTNYGCLHGPGIRRFAMYSFE